MTLFHIIITVFSLSVKSSLALQEFPAIVRLGPSAAWLPTCVKEGDIRGKSTYSPKLQAKITRILTNKLLSCRLTSIFKNSFTI